MTALSTLRRTYWGFIRNKIIGACENPQHIDYGRIGALGIKVCERWRQRRGGLTNFQTDILAEIGDRPSMSHGLTRIDQTKDFEPGNLAWMTNKDRGRRAQISKVG